MTRSVEEVAKRIAGEAAAQGHQAQAPIHPPAGMVVPWRMIEDHLHRFALHSVLQRVIAGELPAGRIDPRDVAEAVLADRMESGPISDLWPVLDALRDEVEAALDRAVADAQLEQGNTGTDLLTEALDLDTDLDRATERGMLTAGLFSLTREERLLFAEVVVDGFPMDALAAARGLAEADVRLEIGRILMNLAGHLNRSREDTWTAYRQLGQVLQEERIDPRTPVTGG